MIRRTEPRNPAGRLIGMLAAAMLLAAVPSVRAQDPDNQRVLLRISDADVDKSIHDGLAHLLRIQRKDGTWSDRQLAPYEALAPGGLSNLATLTMVMAHRYLPGQKQVILSDPPMAKAIEQMTARRDLHSVYARTLRIMAVALLNDPKRQAQLRGDVHWLIEQQIDNGGWGYPGGWNRPERRNWSDHSNSQMAILALREADRAGIGVPRAVWVRARDYWLKSQNRDGGWGYCPPRSINDLRARSYGSMTAAGLATCLILYDQLYAREEGRYDGKRTPRCGRPSSECQQLLDAIDRATQWFEGRFALDKIPGDEWNISRAWMGYYYYCIERIGVAGGRKYIAGADWYRELASRLVSNQQHDGSWGQLDDTCFKLIALMKGRAPILVNKLQYDGDWNNKPRDVANLVDWFSARFETPAGWQLLDIDRQSHDLGDAPIVYLTGHNGPTFTPAQQRRLIEYVWHGGTLVAGACCGSVRFVERCKAYFDLMFPRLSRASLPADHPLWTMHFELEPSAAVIGYSDGCCTRVFLITHDLGGAWQQNLVATQAGKFELAANLFFYATDRRPLHGKLRRVFGGRKPAVTRTVRVARVKHTGDYWADPMAMARLSDTLAGICQIGLHEDPPVDLAADKPDGYPMLWMTGHILGELSDAERTRLRHYLDGGGLLVADAGCGRGTFEADFEKLIDRLWPDARLLPLSQDHPIIAGKVGGGLGAAMKTVRYNRFVRKQSPGLRTVVLKGVWRDRRLAVVFSPFGLICPIDGHACVNCNSLEPDDARLLGANLVLYALARPPTTRPAP